MTKLHKVSRWVPIAIVLTTLACSSEQQVSTTPPRAEDIPQTVAVMESEVTVGFFMNSVTVEKMVAAYRVSKNPVTVAQYSACVRAKACSQPNLSTDVCLHDNTATQTEESGIVAPDNDLRPATRVLPSQAADFCHWVGGRLPSLAEWQLAARGPSPVRYAWGNATPSSEQHYGAPMSNCCAEQCEFEAFQKVGLHPEGHSPSGLEDVLLTPGELVYDERGSRELGYCEKGRSWCVVSGGGGGAIEGLEAFSEIQDTKQLQVIPFGFRCVWENKQ